MSLAEGSPPRLILQAAGKQFGSWDMQPRALKHVAALVKKKLLLIFSSAGDI